MHFQSRLDFNNHFSEASYRNMMAEIEREFPGMLEFRVAETPVFVPADLKTKLLLAGNLVLDQLAGEKLKAACEAAVPEKYRFPQTMRKPHFIALDFGICEDTPGKLSPKLIELQGFPSLFAFQHYLGGKYRKHFRIPEGFSTFFNRLNGFSYQEEMKKLLKPAAGKNTVLLEVYPDRQKTQIDFELTRLYWDIDTVCLSEITRKGRQLTYTRKGITREIDFIYNRVIFDEVERKYPELEEQADLLKNADFEWITHPAWYFSISKYCLPFLNGDSIPETHFASDINKLKHDLSAYVLKPIFSFAGNGVNLHPTPEDIKNLEDPSSFILQEKVTYKPCVLSAAGDEIKTEIRLLYIWPETSTRPKLVTGLARLSKGEMIGVDHNKNLDWVGGSAPFFEMN